MRYLVILLAILLPTIVYAQGEPKISIGEKGNQYSIGTNPISEKISASAYRADPKLFVKGFSDNSHIIAQYELSVLPKDKDILGPFVVKDNNAQEVFDRLYKHFEEGTKIYYEKIVIVCRECSPPKPTNAQGIAVILE